MRYYMCSVRDNKANTQDPPFASPNEHVAVRRFTDGVNTEGTVMNLHPEDFSLFHVGYWHDNGEGMEGTQHIHLTSGIDVKDLR